MARSNAPLLLRNPRPHRSKLDKAGQLLDDAGDASQWASGRRLDRSVLPGVGGVGGGDGWSGGWRDDTHDRPVRGIEGGRSLTSLFSPGSLGVVDLGPRY